MSRNKIDKDTGFSKYLSSQMHITPGGPCEHQEKSTFNLYVPRITHINFLLTILTQWFTEKVMRINKMRKYFHKFSQLILKETYGDQSRELVHAQSNFHYQPPLHNCRCHYSTSPTAKVTSWQWPVFFSDWWWSWNLIDQSGTWMIAATILIVFHLILLH